MSHSSILPTEPDPEDLRDQHVDQFRRLIEEDGTASAPDVERLVDTLAANGGGDLSSDLALDILLNAIVDQARLATGASGAAIALVKDGEMVCRATAGPTAPDLGVRLDTSAGLSGACVATGLVQLCGDTQVDPRVDPLASRQLGVRSILVFPLLESGEVLGVFEIFSPRPQAFGERDIHTLEALARRILNDRKRAAGHIAVADAGADEPVGARFDYPEQELNPSFAAESQSADSPSGADVVESQPTPSVMRPLQRIDLLTAVLASLVIAAGVGLGLLIGWRSGAMSGLTGSRKSGPSTATAAQRPPKPQSPSASINPPAAPIESATARNTQAHDEPALPVRTSKPSTGGLVVFENGKEVFRMLPANAEHRLDTRGQNSQDPNKVATLDANDANARLIFRVEPEYPADAIVVSQEPIVLDAIVGTDGVVENVKPVSGDGALSNAAMAAVRQWHYQPLVVNGRNTSFQTRLSFTAPSTAK